ncbi:MAG: hypothetical protein V2A77_06880 [Pseudomonadota bacterium]
MSPKSRCDVCGSTELVTTFSRIDMQQICATCDSTCSTYFRKDGKPFSYPAAWGEVVAIEVETPRLSDAYASLRRRTGRISDVCHRVLEGQLTEDEGFGEIQQQYKEIVSGAAPSYLVDQATFYVFRDGHGIIRRGRIAKGYFDKPRRIEGGGNIDAYHYWVIDVLPGE